MTAATHSTAPHTEPERLSFHRIRRLDGVALAGTLLTAIAAVLAWLTAFQWAPEVYVPEFAPAGLRWWLVALLHGYLLVRMVEGTWDRCHGYTRLAGGHRGRIPVAPRSLGLYAVLLSAPLWPTVATAWQVNDAAVLVNDAVAQQVALLALPLLVGAVSLTATGVSEYMHDRLWRQQDDEAEHTALTAS